MTSKLDFIAKVLIALSLTAIAVVLFLYQSLAVRYLDLKARHDCAVANHLEFTDTTTNTTIVQPVEELYRSCLNEKGLV